MSYSKTKQRISEFSQNPSENDGDWKLLLKAIGIIIFSGIWLYALSYSLVSGVFIEFAVISFIVSSVITYFKNQYDKKIKSHESIVESLKEKAKSQKNILKKWDWKFQHNIQEYENKVHVEKLIEQFDDLSIQRERLDNFLSEISEQYPKDMKKLEKEIEHFEDTITDKDEEYIDRIKKIKSLRKEIKQTELDLINIDEEISSKEEEILNYIDNNQ